MKSLVGLGHLAHKIRLHREANNLPVGTHAEIQQQIQDQMCGDNPEICWEVDEKGDSVGLRKIVDRAFDFGKAVVRWGRNGFPTVTEQVFQERSNLCQACNYWKGWKTGILTGIGYCGKCGCPAGRISLKLWMATTKCPLHPPKW